MSKKKETAKGIENVEQTLTKTEQFLEQNYKPLLYVLVAAVVLVGLFWLLKLYTAKQNSEALSQMFMAEEYFAGDSLHLGFIDIADEYKRTKSGRLANFYAGASLMQMGQFEEAVTYLNKYSLDDEILAPQAKGLIGDAKAELGDSAGAIKLYMEAADMADNAFHTPIYLMKAGMLHEMEGNFAEALKLYERIRDNYAESNEGRSIDKYIARAKLHID
jgi:tetratricopeptide (TPR) repeat protein